MMTEMESFDDIAAGCGGSLRRRAYANSNAVLWSDASPCTVVEVDRRDDGRVWSIHVRDEATGTTHKVFTPKGQHRPGCWRNLQVAAKRDGLVRVRLCSVDDDRMRSAYAPRVIDIDAGDDA